MKTRMSWPLLLLTLFLPPTTLAQPAGNCLIGPGLAATLLVPYFEVDLNDTNGVTTLLSINNGLDSAALTRVVVWTDFGIPVLAFDVYLDAFDVQTLNMRSVLDGVIPSTGESVDLTGIPFCDAFPPSHANPVLSADEVAQLRADLTGVQGPLLLDCAGAIFGDSKARGYVTVDVVGECSGVEGVAPFFTPAQAFSPAPYFDDGNGESIALNENRLWGDVIYVDFAGNAARGSEAVAVFANEEAFSGPDIFTFYGRFSNFDGRDHRVPLPSTWNQRYLNGGPFAGGADLTVWRDPGQPVDREECGISPSAFPLLDRTLIGDEESNLVQADTIVNFPWATQRVNIDNLDSPFDFGWLQIETFAQAWVQPTLEASGLFSASLSGIPTEFLCDVSPSTLQEGSRGIRGVGQGQDTVHAPGEPPER